MWHIEWHTSWDTEPGEIVAWWPEPIEVQQFLVDWMATNPHHSDFLEIYEDGILQAILWAEESRSSFRLEKKVVRRDCVLPEWEYAD